MEHSSESFTLYKSLKNSLEKDQVSILVRLEDIHLREKEKEYEQGFQNGIKQGFKRAIKLLLGQI